MVKLYVILDIRVEVVMSYKCYNCGKKFDDDIESCDKCGDKKVKFNSNELSSNKISSNKLDSSSDEV